MVGQERYAHIPICVIAYANGSMKRARVYAGCTCEHIEEATIRLARTRRRVAYAGRDRGREEREGIETGGGGSV